MEGVLLESSVSTQPRLVSCSPAKQIDPTFVVFCGELVAAANTVMEDVSPILATHYLILFVLETESVSARLIHEVTLREGYFV